MAQKVTEPRELFLHDLGAMLKAERQIVKALPRMQKAADDDELATRLGKHVEETKRQIETSRRRSRSSAHARSAVGRRASTGSSRS